MGDRGGWDEAGCVSGLRQVFYNGIVRMVNGAWRVIWVWIVMMTKMNEWMNEWWEKHLEY